MDQNQFSVFGIVLLAYANGVMFEYSKHAIFGSPIMITLPIWMSGLLPTLFFFVCVPLPIWTFIYIKLFEGWMITFIIWLVLQIASTIVVNILGVKSYLPIHFIIASICAIVGYYFTITSLIA